MNTRISTATSLFISVQRSAAHGHGRCVSESVRVAQRAGAESQPRRSRVLGKRKLMKEKSRQSNSNQERLKKKREKACPRSDTRAASPVFFTRERLLRRSANPLTLDRPLVRAPRVRRDECYWVVRSHSRRLPLVPVGRGPRVEGDFRLLFKLSAGRQASGEIGCWLGGRSAWDL